MVKKRISLFVEDKGWNLFLKNCTDEETCASEKVRSWIARYNKNIEKKGDKNGLVRINVN